MSAAKKVRVSARVQSFVDSGSLGIDPDDLDTHGYGDAGRRLVEKLRGAFERADGSVCPALDREERDVLEELAECLADAAGDDAGVHDHDALADLNSARALVGNLVQLRVREALT